MACDLSALQAICERPRHTRSYRNRAGPDVSGPLAEGGIGNATAGARGISNRRRGSVRNELERDLEARLGGLAVLVLRDRERPAAHEAGDAGVDLFTGEAARFPLGRATGLVDGQRERNLAARARVLVQIVLVAALEAGHVRL